jgi:hypothetical protein
MSPFGGTVDQVSLSSYIKVERKKDQNKTSQNSHFRTLILERINSSTGGFV